MVFLKPQLFFTTPPSPCPYKEGEEERKLVTEISRDEAVYQYDLMIKAGFRRSHTYLYRPQYDRSEYCLSVRVRIKDFSMRKSQKRIWNKNADLTPTTFRAIATEEQYQLFSPYVRGRHSDGDMSTMNWSDYKDMLESSPIDTDIIEFRTPDNNLIAACIVDWVHRGVSAVYSFFDVTQPDRGLGSYMILWLIEQARVNKLDYVYLGYWIKEAPKMSYKSKYKPIEALRNGLWEDISEDM